MSFLVSLWCLQPPKKEEATRCTESSRSYNASRGESASATAGVDGERRARRRSMRARRRASPWLGKGVVGGRCRRAEWHWRRAQPGGVAGILAAMAAVGLTSAALCSPSQQPGSDPAVSQKLQDIKSRLKPLLDRAREGRHHPACGLG